MAWRLRAEIWLDFVPAGIGPMSGQLSPLSGQIGGAGPSQTLEFFNTGVGETVPGTGAATAGNNALAGADITTLLTALTTDMSAQMNASLGRLNGFLSGGG